METRKNHRKTFSAILYNWIG